MIQNKRYRHSPVRAMLLTALLAPGLLVSACFSSPDPACAFSCGQNNTCPDNYRCVSDGWCKRSDVADDFVCSSTPLLDASSTNDSAVIDGSIVDGSDIDAMSVDAMPTDANTPDAMVPDAMMAPDAMVPDAMPDAMVPDATVPDATVPDAMIPDATPS